MVVLRTIGQQSERIARARAYAARPYEIVVLSDHSRTEGATFWQRNGHGLEELVRDSVEQAEVVPLAGGDENDTVVGKAVREATGRKQEKPATNDAGGHDVVVLGSGNLGLMYLMEERRRYTLEEIERRHPRMLPARRGAAPGGEGLQEDLQSRSGREGRAHRADQRHLRADPAGRGRA